MAATEGTIRHAMSRGFWGSAEDASKWLAHRTGGSASDAVQRVHRLQAWVKANPRTAVRPAAPALPTISAWGTEQGIGGAPAAARGGGTRAQQMRCGSLAPRLGTPPGPWRSACVALDVVKAVRGAVAGYGDPSGP